MLTIEDVRSRAVLTAPEAAQLLDQDVQSVYRQAKLGQLPAQRLGRKVVIPVPALLRWLGDDQPEGAGQ